MKEDKFYTGKVAFVTGAYIRDIVAARQLQALVGLPAERIIHDYRSLGSRPVFFAIRANIFGPISSLS